MNCKIEHLKDIFRKGPEYDYAVAGWKINSINNSSIIWTCDVKKFTGRATNIEFKTEDVHKVSPAERIRKFFQRKLLV